MVKSVYIDIEGTCAKDKATFQKVLCMYIVQKICSGCRNGTWRTCLASSLEAIADRFIKGTIRLQTYTCIHTYCTYWLPYKCVGTMIHLCACRQNQQEEHASVKYILIYVLPPTCKYVKTTYVNIHAARNIAMNALQKCAACNLLLWPSRIQAGIYRKKLNH